MGSKLEILCRKFGCFGYFLVIPCRQVLHRSAGRARPLAQFGWASFPCRPSRRGPSSRWWRGWRMCGAVGCAWGQLRTATILAAAIKGYLVNYSMASNYNPTCLRISSVTRCTPRCCGLRWIFLCSQAGWPTMRPCPRPDPDPLEWLAEQAMTVLSLWGRGRRLLQPPPPESSSASAVFWLQLTSTSTLTVAGQIVVVGWEFTAAATHQLQQLSAIRLHGSTMYRNKQLTLCS